MGRRLDKLTGGAASFLAAAVVAGCGAAAPSAVPRGTVTLSGAVTESETVNVLAGVNDWVIGSTGWLLEMSPDTGLPLLSVAINLPEAAPQAGTFGAADCLAAGFQLDVGVVGVTVTPQWSLAFDSNNAIPDGGTFRLTVSSTGPAFPGNGGPGWTSVWPGLHGILVATLLPVATNAGQQSGEVDVTVIF